MKGQPLGEYETAASEHVGDSRKRLVVTLVNASRLLVTYLDCPVLSSFYRVRFESKRVIPGAMRSWDPLALLDALGCMWLKERPGI
jgi:hypothetical protein